MYYSTKYYSWFVIFVIVFFAMTSVVFAQNNFTLDVQHFGIEKGLSHRQVHCAYQDKRGLMWFGTNNGLNKFDGHHFEWFTCNNNNLQSNVIEHIMADYEGNMWLMYGSTKVYSADNPNLKNIDIFNPVTKDVEPFTAFFAAKTQLTPQSIHSFTQNDKQEIILLTKRFQLITYTNKGIFTTTDLSQNYHFITNFHWSKNGYLWFQGRKENRLDSPQYVIALDENGQEVHAFLMESVKNLRTFFYEQVNSTNEYWMNIDESEEDNHKVLAFNEVRNDGKLIQSQKGKFEGLNLDFSDFGKIAGMVDDGDLIWMFSTAGFYLLNRENKEIIRLDEIYEDIGFAYQIFIDNQNQTWVCTDFGVFLIKIKPNLFSKMLYSEDGLNPIRGMTMFDNSLFLVREKHSNIWKLNLSSDNKKILSQEIAIDESIGRKLPFLEYSYALLKSRDNQLLNANHKCFSKLNPDNFDYQYWQVKKSDKKFGHIWSIYEDKYGKYWFAYGTGFLGYLEDGTYQYLPKLDSTIVPLQTYQFLEYKDDEVLLMTKGGIFVLDIGMNRIKARYWRGGKGKYYLPQDEIFHAYLDKDNSLWLATNNYGLVHFNLDDGGSEAFTQADGLANNIIYGIYADDFENLWFSSDYGIMCFNKNTKQVSSFQTQNGITHNEFNRVSHYQHEDGTIFFGSLNGITVFHPKDFQLKNTQWKMPLIITKFYEFEGNKGRQIDKTQDLLANKVITILPNNLFCRLEFALLTYENANKVRYAYQIEGLDDDWLYQKENYIRISRLPYGNYTMRIKAQAANGQWTKEYLVIKIIVNRPFYQTSVFIACLILFLSIFSFIIYKWRISTLEKGQRELEKVVEERTAEIREDKITIEKQAEELKLLEALKSRFFTNVSHELRTPLTLILGPINSLLKKESRDESDLKLLELAKRNGTELLKLVNEILDLSKLEESKLDLKIESMNLYRHLEGKLSQFFSFAASKGISLHIDYKLSRDLELSLDIEKSDKIMINFLSNALKFTPEGGSVTLIAKVENEAIIFMVKDSGQGIHPEDLPFVFNRFYQSKHTNRLGKGGTGIGLSLCKELAELMKGEVWVESEFRKGSTFYFKLPIQKSEVAQQVQSNNKTIFPSPLTFESSELLISDLSMNKEPTILLVEDNRDLQMYIQHILERYKVITADNGRRALDILETTTESIDLIISDLMMPIMNGFELIEQLKNDDKYRHLPMIMLTGKASVKTELKALRIGIDDYMLKPFKEELLIARIQNLLENSRMKVNLLEEIASGKGGLMKEEKVTFISSDDAKWLVILERMVLNNIDNTNYTVERLADDLLMSKSSLNRQVKKIVGLSPNKYMVEVRLQKARELLENHEVNSVKAAAYAIGFLKTDYFSKIFQEKYGISPLDFLQ